MKTGKFINAVAVGLTSLALVIVPVYASHPELFCEHKETVTYVAEHPTCTENGREDVLCLQCDTVLKNHEMQALGHSFGEYEIVTMPTAAGNGVKVHTCTECGMEEEEDYVCPHEMESTFIVRDPSCAEEGRAVTICEICDAVTDSFTLDKLQHENTYASVIREATCSCEGLKQILCEDCGAVVEEHVLEPVECSYGDWFCSKYATPFEDGEMSRQCSGCGMIEAMTYSMSMSGENSIYIPGTDINACFHIGHFTQADVNRYDIVYTENAYGTQDSNNPFVLGHNTGSLKTLSQTKVGQYIYVSVNGKIEVYEVLVSEYAVQEPRGINMIGQTTGTNIWDTYASDIPDAYTSYGKQHEGKDLWDANDGKTLHMYTCHENSKAGGRWIVMAVQV